MINKFDLGTIVVLELAKPPLNALSPCFLMELYKELKLAEKDTQKTGIILRSKYAGCFSSGLDLGKLPKSKYKRRCEILLLVYMVYKIVRFITCSKKIYIASLTGAVIGSAVSLAMACDFCFAAPDVWFWLPDPFYGGVLADGGIELIKKNTGIADARRLCLTNQRISVREAREMGMVFDIIEKSDLSSRVQSFAFKLSAYSHRTLQETKGILNRDIGISFPLLRLLRVIWSGEMEERMNQILGNKSGGSHESGK